MAQISHRSANTLSRVTIFGAIFIAGFVLWVIGGIVRSLRPNNASAQAMTAAALDMTSLLSLDSSQGMRSESKGGAGWPHLYWVESGPQP